MKIFIGADLVPTSANSLTPNAVSEQAFIDGNIEQLFSDVLPLMQGADVTIVNLECALTDTNVPIKKIGPNLKASPKCALSLKKAGITDCALSNNHVFDYGKKGLEDTVKALEEVGLAYMGIGANDTDSRKVHYIKKCGKIIAVVNVCEHEYTYALPDRMGTNPFDPFLTMADIREAKKNADVVIVLYHGGKEQCRYPSPRLVNACREMVHNGADVVLTQHSHCIGCYEQYQGAHILHGQGNFHFARENADDKWNTGFAVELHITDKVDIKFYPFEAKGATISLVKGARYEELMSAFEKRNEELRNGEWRQGWRAFVEQNKARYVNAICNPGKAENEEQAVAFLQTFAHLLDCEAHTDMWRELYPTWNLTNEK